MRIAMIGGGYVGLVSGACFAEFGTDVTVVETDAGKLAALHEGRMPIYEPGLDKLVAENVAAGRLAFTGDLAAAVRDAEAVFIAVGTPTRARRRPCRPHLRLCRRRAGGARAHRLCGDRHQVHRPGRHRPPHRGDRPHARVPTWTSTSPPTRNSCAKATPSATSCGPTAW